VNSKQHSWAHNTSEHYDSGKKYSIPFNLVNFCDSIRQSDKKDACALEPNNDKLRVICMLILIFVTPYCQCSNCALHPCHCSVFYVNDNDISLIFAESKKIKKTAGQPVMEPRTSTSKPTTDPQEDGQGHKNGLLVSTYMTTSKQTVT